MGRRHTVANLFEGSETDPLRALFGPMVPTGKRDLDAVSDTVSVRQLWRDRTTEAWLRLEVLESSWCRRTLHDLVLGGDAITFLYLRRWGSPHPTQHPSMRARSRARELDRMLVAVAAAVLMMEGTAMRRSCAVEAVATWPEPNAA